MRTIWSDFRYALRTLARTPAFTAAAIATLALGIGATTAIFSLIHAVLVKPMPYERPGELVRIWGSYTGRGVVLPRSNVSPLDALDWRSRSRTLSAIALWNTGRATLTGGAEPLRVRLGATSANFLETLGVQPAIGSGFTVANEVDGANRIVLLSDGFWKRRFAADPRVAGTSLTLDGIPYTVVGVLPPHFRSPAATPAGEPELWRPMVPPKDPGARGGHYLMAVGRLARGSSRDAAQTEMDGIAGSLRSEFPATNTGWSVLVEGLQHAAARDQRPTLLVLAGGVGCLLAIACTNVAGLLLSRGAARRREVGIRRALGAGTGRLLAEQMAESLVLGAAGGVAGVLLSLWLVQLLQPLSLASPGTVPNALEPEVLLFAAAVSILSAIAFGLAPALAASRIEPQTALKETPGSPGSSRLRQVLVAIEAGAAVLLLAMAGLFGQSLRSLLAEDPGFRPEGVVTFTIAPPKTRYKAPEQAVQLELGLEDRLAALPGVTGVGAINTLPLSGGYSCDSFALADRPAPPAGTEPCAENRVVAGQYHRTLGVPLREGRLFTRDDRAGAPMVAIVNETFARAFWPRGSALGQKIKWGDVGAETPWLTVVGVVGDVRHFGPGELVRPQIDTPFAQGTLTSLSYVVRADRQVAVGLGPAIRAAVGSLDKDLPADDVRLMTDFVGRSVAGPSGRAGLTAAFAAAALLLAAVGIFAAVAFAVARSTREIGIRMALGAGRRHILGRVVGRGLRPVAAGLAVGLAAAAAAGRFVASLLFRVPPLDPVVFLGAPLLLAAVALLAAYLPARRAAGVNPITALRTE